MVTETLFPDTDPLQPNQNIIKRSSCLHALDAEDKGQGVQWCADTLVRNEFLCNIDIRQRLLRRFIVRLLFRGEFLLLGMSRKPFLKSLLPDIIWRGRDEREKYKLKNGTGV